MAATVAPAMCGEGVKSIHPFFTKTNGGPEQHEGARGPNSADSADETQHPGQLDDTEVPGAKVKRARKARQPAEPEAKAKKQKTLQDIVNPHTAANPQLGPHGEVTAVNPAPYSAVDPAHRDRRQTGEPECVELRGQEDASLTLVHEQATDSPRVVIPASSPVPEQPSQPVADVANVSKTPPKKVLRLNANGKLSSPISKKIKPDDGQAPSEIPKKRGRPRKSKEGEVPKQRVVRIVYGRDESTRASLGQKLDRILAGEERVQLALSKKQAGTEKSHAPKAPPKTTHPFFLSKPKDPPAPAKHESPRKTSATTPGKLKRHVFGDRLQDVKEASYAVGSALLKDRLMVKHPGAREPPWPAGGRTHIRGLNIDEDHVQSHFDANAEQFVRRRKRKAARLPFPPEESVLERFASVLAPAEDGALRPDGFREPHPTLRLPQKLLISGNEIRQRVAPELRASLYDDVEDELSLPATSSLSAHPALQGLWARIPKTLTAFDDGRGDTQEWAQKYAPTAAAQVLQPAQELTVLKDWLNSLTVTAVESTVSVQAKSAVKSEPKPKKKRRRKPDDLDDFLVDDDEDLHTMDELPALEGGLINSNSKTQKSVIQVAVEGAKLSNAVLLSGPHGCGKTAAAYAVAKELNFKVFEISAHERRSGKDILDKVGNMTENHLVRHHGTDTGESSSNEEPIKARLDEAFEKDLASGRQGKMNTFFKPKAASKPAAREKPKAVAKAQTLKAVEKAIKKQPKDQQQSLILLEEVDILFKDDKEFWSTVLKLIVTSKRPFIMTCNDEDLVPLQAMNLHAILRFSPPSVDLAVDYMLLIAASEGHLLERAAVAQLYNAKGRDLRASITELDLWCQMGVGDPKGGLSWIYQRWPPGSDVDAQGQKLRIVSQGTYQKGMSLLPDRGLSDEDQMMWAWRELGTEPMDLLRWHERGSDATGSQRMAALREYGHYAYTLSSADVSLSCGTSGTAPLDPTGPPMTDKARNQYIEGLALQQVDEQTDYSGLNMELAVASMCTLARSSSSLTIARVNELTLDAHKPITKQALTRHDFVCFDAISAPAEGAPSAGPDLIQSVFDGPLEPITTDLAPYVRSIVQYDLALEEQRQRLSSLMADGDGRKARRARTTRAARSALEGGQRATTRKDRWFTKVLNLSAVLATGGSEWPKTGVLPPEVASVEGSETPTSSMETE